MIKNDFLPNICYKQMFEQAKTFEKNAKYTGLY